ncbi:MAG: hypothetical protein JW940_26330 [Polyangiaceae bacterium]|nr:hypothetical protein [Polyangiaceae bacterium]
MKAEHQIARLEQLLERVRRNAAAPRVGPTSPVREPIATGPLPEPMELSDDDLIGVVSDAPPGPDATTEQAVATAVALLGQQPPLAVVPEQTEGMAQSIPPAGIPTHELPRVLTWPPERRPLQVDPTLRPPKPEPAKLQPLPMNLVSELPSESSWRPSAPKEVVAEGPSPADSLAAEELAEGDEAGIEAPLLTPPPESGHQLLPESPRAWTAGPSQSAGKLELVEEQEEDIEAEGVPPSGRKVTETYSLPPGTEQFVQHVELDEALGGELELEELPEPPRASTTLASPPSLPMGEDLAEPGVQEARVVAGLAVEVTRRPEVPSGTAPAQYTSVRQGFAPRTFLELLDASLGLGNKS